MKCNICDKDLNEKEVNWNKEINTFDPCAVCLEIAFDAAFSDGFSRPDEDDSFVIVEDDDPTYFTAFSTMLGAWSRGNSGDEE